MSKDSNEGLSRRSILEIDRRKFIKATGVTAGVAALGSQVASAEKPSEYYLGDTEVIEISLMHEGFDDHDLHGDGGGYRYFTTNSQLSLGTGTTAETIQTIEDNAIISTFHSKFFTMGSSIIQRSKNLLTVASNFYNRNPRYVMLSNEHTPPQITPKRKGSNSVILQIEGESYNLPKNSKREISLSPREVHPEDRDGSRSVVPVVVARHSGPLETYGLDGKVVVPKNSGSAWIRSVAHRLREKGRRNPDQPPHAEENNKHVIYYHSN